MTMAQLVVSIILSCCPKNGGRSDARDQFLSVVGTRSAEGIYLTGIITWVIVSMSITIAITVLIFESFLTSIVYFSFSIASF